MVKPKKPLKVPEVEKFYKLPDSRAVVEFRINTGFTASCFFGTLLVALVTTSDAEMEKKADLMSLVEEIKALDLSAKLCGVIHIINDGLADVVQSDETRVLLS